MPSFLYSNTQNNPFPFRSLNHQIHVSESMALLEYADCG